MTCAGSMESTSPRQLGQARMVSSSGLNGIWLSLRRLRTGGIGMGAVADGPRGQAGRPPTKIAPVEAITALMNEWPTRVRTGLPPAARMVSGTTREQIRL